MQNVCCQCKQVTYCVLEANILSEWVSEWVGVSVKRPSKAFVQISTAVCRGHPYSPSVFINCSCNNELNSHCWTLNSSPHSIRYQWHSQLWQHTYLSAASATITSGTHLYHKGKCGPEPVRLQGRDCSPPSGPPGHLNCRDNGQGSNCSHTSICRAVDKLETACHPLPVMAAHLAKTQSRM